jgi:hypothetical protein
LWVQPRICLEEKVAVPVYETEITAVGNRRADYATPSIRKSWHWLGRTSGGRSVGIVRSRNKATEFSFTRLRSWTYF